MFFIYFLEVPSFILLFPSRSFNLLEKTGVEITFTIANFAAMGYEVRFDWEFGSEGTLENVTEMTATYTFTQPGNHLVRLNASNAISSGSYEVTKYADKM